MAVSQWQVEDKGAAYNCWLKYNLYAALNAQFSSTNTYMFRCEVGEFVRVNQVD